jgi:hypothetical protein
MLWPQEMQASLSGSARRGPEQRVQQVGMGFSAGLVTTTTRDQTRVLLVRVDLMRPRRSSQAMVFTSLPTSKFRSRAHVFSCSRLRGLASCSITRAAHSPQTGSSPEGISSCLTPRAIGSTYKHKRPCIRNVKLAITFWTCTAQRPHRDWRGGPRLCGIQ